jgi:hypothetical protein
MRNFLEKIMNSDPNRILETFVQRFFASHGADIEQGDTKLHVLTPRKLARQIGIPEFCSLKIGDPDDSDYGVHYGSPLLERIAEVACETVPFTVVQLTFHYLKSQGFARLLRDLFTFHGAVAQVDNAAEVKTDYLLLNCHYLAQSDEQKEGLVPLAFHLETGAPVGNLKTMLDVTEKTFEPGGLSAGLEDAKLRQITQWVQRRAPKIVEMQIESFRESMNRRFRRDVVNLEEYYSELQKEMAETLKRPGLTEQLILERKEKIALIPDEMAKKKDDLFKKYSIKVKLRLSGAMLIRTPAVKLFCRAAIGRRKINFPLYYNPIDKSLDPMVCAGCGDGTYQIYFCHKLHLLCPQCRPSCPVCG